MPVDWTHRAITREYPPSVYRSLASDCARALEATGLVDALVVCGSVAKMDVVQGWSDLDLVAFCNQTDRLRRLDAVAHALSEASRDIRIGIGVDVVFLDQFRRTYRLGGRPIAMTHEVAEYGLLEFGESPWLGIPPRNLTRIAQEAAIARAEEVHNWRRAYIVSRREGVLAGDRDWLARCTKTLLKLLKYESDDLPGPPYTYGASLDRLVATRPHHVSLPSFRKAVETRARWMEVAGNADLASQTVQEFEATLAAYPL